MAKIREILHTFKTRVENFKTTALESQAADAPEDEKAPLRPIKFTSLFYFQQSHRLWTYLLFSLPLDFGIAALELPHPPPQFETLLTYTMAGLVTLSLLALARDWVISALLKIESLQLKANAWRSKYSWLLLAGFLLLIFIEAIAKMGMDAISLLIALAITLGAFRSMRKTMSERKDLGSRLSKDRSFWIEQTNYKVFLVSVIPMGAARLISIVGLLQVKIGDGSISNSLLYIFAALALLYTLEPQEEHFMMRCKGCANRTSRALQGSGYCPACEKIRAGK